MEIDRISMQSQTSFGKLNIIKKDGLTEKIAEAIEASPAMKKFGRRYNADVYYQEFSNRANTKVYKGLLIDEIRPKNIFYRFLDYLRGTTPEFNDFISYNSYKTTDVEFIEAIKSMNKNKIFNIYNK